MISAARTALNRAASASLSEYFLPICPQRPWRDLESNLDMIESLKPRAVVAGHKRPGRPDAPSIVEETRQYIRDFDRIAAGTQTARELYDQMLTIHPDRVNPAVLWNSARSVKG